jgi:hypothetical protein
MVREDDGPQFGTVLRRITVLVVVLTAIPAVLWVITSVVRDYVGPPSLPYFRQQSSAKSARATAAPEDRAPADTDATTIEARASVSDARTTDDRGDDSAPKGPFLGERAQEATAGPPATVTPIDQNGLHTAAQNAAQRAAMLPGGSAPAAPAGNASGPVATAATVPTGSVPATAAPAGNVQLSTGPVSTGPASTGPVSAGPAAVAPPPWPQPGALPTPMTAAPQAAVAPPSGNDDTLAGAPLPGKIPLPRRRPHIDTRLAQAATTAPGSSPAGRGSVPIPRPRPSAAGAGTPATEDRDSGATPLNFLQNLLR